MHPRQKLRADLRALLSNLAELSDWTLFKAWAHRPDESQLPAYGVFTPRETVVGSTGSEVNKTVDVVVALRLSGGDDIEDEMDAISAAVEAAVLAHLEAEEYPQFALISTDLPLSQSGGIRLGDIDMLFQVERYVPQGQP